MEKIKKRCGFFMGWFFTICSGFVLLSVVDATVAVAGDNKVGIIDTAKIIIKSKYAHKIKEEFTAEMGEQREALDRKREDVKKLQQRLLDAKESGKRSSTIEKAEEEFEKSIRELKWMKDDFDKDLLEMDKALVGKIKKRVKLVVDQFITTTDYCIVIEKHRVAAFCDSADITDEIIKRLDSYRD